MGLRDELRRRSAARRVDQRVNFLGEQAGGSEGGLKRELILEFAARPSVQRAYLAQIGYEPDDKPAMALCLATNQLEDDAIVRRAGEIFARMFSAEASLDVVFLTADQEAELRKVCRPFYARPF